MRHSWGQIMRICIDNKETRNIELMTLFCLKPFCNKMAIYIIPFQKYEFNYWITLENRKNQYKLIRSNVNL